jgi:hypothetical protein
MVTMGTLHITDKLFLCIVTMWTFLVPFRQRSISEIHTIDTFSDIEDMPDAKKSHMVTMGTLHITDKLFLCIVTMWTFLVPFRQRSISEIHTIDTLDYFFLWTP